MEDLFITRFLKWSKTQASNDLFRWIEDKGECTRTMTWNEVNLFTEKLAKCMLSEEWGLKRGDRALLVYPPSLDFILCFIACLRAGIVAVPVFPPDPRQLHKNLHLFISVQTSSGAKVAFTNTEYQWVKRIAGIKNIFVSKSSATWPEVQWVETNGTLPNVKDVVIDIAKREELAFLQYTSGSTSDPKGVMLTNGNLAHNMTCIVKSLRADTKTIVVSWLPQYHDMGLIGSYLSLMYCGGSGVYMSPISFIRNPPVWMETISKYKGSHLQAPNFAYILSARKFRAQYESRGGSEGFSLASIQHMFNAAEPVTAEAIDVFYETFKPFGLKDGVVVPGYGLAEHCVYVCDGGKERIVVNKEKLEKESIVEVAMESATTSQIVGCGFPSNNPDIIVLIVDPKSNKLLGEDKVGEIWIDSPSKAQGYYGLEEKSKEEFHAVLNGEEGEDNNEAKKYSKNNFLRTGDLGFLHKGELFICGRIKDLIIIRGRNHYPQDLEHCAEQDERIRPGCSAAFSISINNNSNEVLVLLCEVKDEGTIKYDELASSIRSLITNEHGVSLYALVLLKPRSNFKTSSGKIARQRCKAGYLAKELQAVFTYTSSEDGVSEEYEKELASMEKGSWDSKEDLVKKLCEDACKFLGEEARKEGVDPNTPLIDLGMDSMSLAQFKGLLHAKYAVTMSDEELFAEETCLTTVSDFIMKHGVNNTTAEAEKETVSVAKSISPTEVVEEDDSHLSPEEKKKKKCSIM